MAVRLSSPQGRLALSASILGSGMAFLDSTAVQVALPAIESELGAGFAGLQWILGAYLLALSACVLPGGALGDRFGRKRVFLVGLGAFALASAACALAPSLALLVLARALQGLGAALLVPASLALLQGGFASEERGRAIGLWSGCSGLATVVGPLLGGWLVDAGSWRLVFWVNPALALVTALVAARWAPESRDMQAKRLDPAGSALAVLALGGLVLALTEGPARGWSHPAVLAGALACALSAPAFVLVESRAAAPMLPLRLFRSRRFAAITLASVPVYFALGGALFLLTLELQRVLGYSALAAGGALAPISLCLLVLSPLAGRLAERFGPRPLLTLGPLVAAAALVGLARVHAGSRYAPELLPGVLVLGLGLGLTVAPLTATAMGALEDARAGLASGVSNAVARAAQLVAVALLPLAAGLSGIERIGGEAFTQGVSRALQIAAGALVVAAGIAWLALGGPLAQPGRESETR